MINTCLTLRSLVFLQLFLLFYINRIYAQPSDQQQRYKNDILPGPYNAVLSLYDGTRINLDSTGLSYYKYFKVPAIFNGKNQLSYNPKSYKTDTLDQSKHYYHYLLKGKGKPFMVLLPDGTRAWLNADATIYYPLKFKGKERRVEVSGEVYMEVAFDANHPFVANIPNMDVQTSGGNFNINSYLDEANLKVTVLKGTVTVKLVKGMTGSMALKTGQQCIIGKYGGLRMAEYVDLKEIMAWKNNRFYFKKTDLTAILRQVIRWYKADISAEHEFYGAALTVFADVDIPRDVPVSELLKKLELTNKVRFKIEGNLITVTQYGTDVSIPRPF
jgi:transmembrane sensor